MKALQAQIEGGTSVVEKFTNKLRWKRHFRGCGQIFIGRDYERRSRNLWLSACFVKKPRVLNNATGKPIATVG
jgi:hypothetical protein